jgi:hypothetical protein
VVRTAAGAADLWSLKGVETRFERWITRNAGRAEAELEVQNAWYVGEKPILRETVRFVVYPAAAGSREFTARVILEALEEPVTIGGAQEQGKGYGGFNCRFAPRENTAIRSSDGPVPADENHGPHGWAELEGSFAGARAGLRITAAPGNPGYPNEWCLRHYGFVGASFPGAGLFRIEPGKALKFEYRVRVFDQ